MPSQSSLIQVAFEFTFSAVYAVLHLFKEIPKSVGSSFVERTWIFLDDSSCHKRLTFQGRFLCCRFDATGWHSSRHKERKSLLNLYLQGFTKILTKLMECMHSHR